MFRTGSMQDAGSPVHETRQLKAKDILLSNESEENLEEGTKRPDLTFCASASSPRKWT